MEIKLPSQADFDAIAATQPHRHPEKAAITVPGDGGVLVRLPFILGNPSGASRLQSGARPSPAWSTTVAVLFKAAPDSSTLSDQLVQDCILWPDRATWATWADRWPGLAVSVFNAARQKFGGALDNLEEPGFDEPPPERIFEMLSQHPRAIWRRLRVRQETALLVIEPPSAIGWRLFRDAMQKRDADHWKLVCELAEASVLATAKEDGAGAQASAELIERWPGMAVAVVTLISQLAGTAAETELGEW
jgi:hypothetical protein